MRLYLDTSVINGLHAHDTPHIRAATQAFFARLDVKAVTLYGSDLVAAEIERTPRLDKRAKLYEVIATHDVELLPVTDEARELAERYVTAKIIPARYLPDALHIATSVVHNIPILVSWNFEHIVRHRTRVEVNRINQALGYPTIDLCTPEEV